MSPGRRRGLLLYFAQGPTGCYGARLAVGSQGFLSLSVGRALGPLPLEAK